MLAPDQRSLDGSRIRRRLRPGCVESVCWVVVRWGKGGKRGVYGEDFPFFICTA